MARVNIVKQIKINGNWVLRSIPKKPSGTYDWTALPEGTYFIEWRDSGQRKREPVGITASQALEAQRKKRHSLEGRRWSIRPPAAQQSVDAGNSPLQALIERYLEQVETLKKPNTFRKYECVLQRFAEYFRGRTLSDITVEQLNDFVVKLKKGGMSANTVLHNVIIVSFPPLTGQSARTRILSPSASKWTDWPVERPIDRSNVLTHRQLLDSTTVTA